MERVVKLVFGDWSDDGHGKTDTVIVKLSGQDVSDEALEASRVKSDEDFGQNLLDLFSNYEDNTISPELYQALVEDGFGGSDGEDDFIIYVVGQGVAEEAKYLSALEVFLYWLGRNIEDFNYEVLTDEYPTLVGGYNSILKSPEGWSSTSFGYGLYFS